MKAVVASLAIVTALIVPARPALCQPDPSAELYEDTRRLMELTGAGNLAVQIMHQMLQPMRRALPQVPEEFWSRFMEKVDTDEIIDMTVPIYTKHLTHAEIKQLLDFYQSPLGRKLIATLPSILAESMQAGQRWGEQLGRQVREELEAEGYLESQDGSES